MERGTDRPQPRDVQPPLTLWRHTWRLLLSLALSAIVWPPYAVHQWHDARWLFWLDLGAGVASFGLVLLHRRWPVPIALITNALACVSASASGPSTLAAASVATRRRWPPIGLVALVSVVASTVLTSTQPGRNQSFWLDLTVAVIVVVGTMGWGMYIGSRRELVWTLRNRAERAEAEQELRAAQARVTERQRIAREMHDVLAHRISQISMHAGALAFREDLDADQMRVSAGVIQEKAHEALTDLRGVLGVLRDESGELLDAPQPTYADLVGLVEEARGSGVDVDFEDTLADETAPVPDAVGRTVYRIVQEGITNARKHAPGTRLSIEITGSPDTGIDLVLSNPIGFVRTATPGAGLGLVGLSERAELRGGHLEHVRDDTGFVLRGWIPWAA